MLHAAAFRPQLLFLLAAPLKKKLNIFAQAPYSSLHSLPCTQCTPPQFCRANAGTPVLHLGDPIVLDKRRAAKLIINAWPCALIALIGRIVRRMTFDCVPSITCTRLGVDVLLLKRADVRRPLLAVWSGGRCFGSRSLPCLRPATKEHVCSVSRPHMHAKVCHTGVRLGGSKMWNEEQNSTGRGRAKTERIRFNRR